MAGLRFFLAGLLVIVMFLPTQAYAIEMNGTSLGPTIVDKMIKPGESFEQVFNIQNRSGEPVEIEAYVQDFRVEKDYWHKVDNPDTRWSPMTWATIASAPKRLANMEQGKIRVIFNVPKNAEMGEHLTYFNVRFIPGTNAINTKGEQGAGITVASEIRSLVYVKVTDPRGNFELKQSWRLLKAGTGFWHFGKPVFSAAAENNGNVHLEVRGNIVVKDVIRNQTAELNVPTFNILPGADKKIDITWNDAPFIGYFHGKMQLTYDGKNFEERQFSFATVPLLTLTGTLLTFTGIIFAVALYIRKLKKQLAMAEQRQSNIPGE
ncbi:MAG: hypothetical protein ACOY46_10925 [Bacillota bacterium]